MIITEQFVMLNFPKTGSTFARNIIKQLYSRYQTIPYQIMMGLGMVGRRSISEFYAIVVDTNRNRGRKVQHGTYRQIPPEHAHKKIVSIVRNPFDRYVSGYLYKFWVRRPLAPLEELCSIWPHFPDLSFMEYYEMLHRFGREERIQGVQLKMDLGFNSLQFVQFYFPDPNSVLNTIDNEYIKQKKYMADMPAVKFIHQEHLNQELYEFLSELGYPNQDIAFIKQAQKQNVSQRTEDQKKTVEFYTPELIGLIYERDAFLFELFPEYKSLPDV